MLGGSIYIAINFAAGLAYALNDGLDLQGSTGSRRITTISSSAIVAKVLFDLRRTVNPETEMILSESSRSRTSFWLSILSGIVLSGATSVRGILGSAGLALGFILTLIILGRLATPFLDRALRISSNEVFLLVIFGGLFLLAGLGKQFT